MAWTASDLEAIESAIATGTRAVQFGDRSVQYQSMRELLEARDVIKAAIDSTSGQKTSCTFAKFTKD